MMAPAELPRRKKRPAARKGGRKPGAAFVVIVLLIAATVCWMAIRLYQAAVCLMARFSSSNTVPLVTTTQLLLPPKPISAHNHQRRKLLMEKQEQPQPPDLVDDSNYWPQLSDVYDGHQIVGDPQFLLDFAVIGFEKSGTSTLMKWLGGHDQVQMFQQEVYDLYQNDTATLVWRLYTQLPAGQQYQRGYKSPIDAFSANALYLFSEYFPLTRLIVALRHPVLYFESLYNFRIQNLPGPHDPFILPLEGLGLCKNWKIAQGVCVDHANFAEYLYRMGHTVSHFPHGTDQDIVNGNRKSASKTKRTRNLVFVVEMSQLMDQDEMRQAQLKADLQAFLRLEHPLAEAPLARPGKQWSDDVQAVKESRKMNICEAQYEPLRTELMKVSQLSSVWIRERFVASSHVYVSSPDFFDLAVEKWMYDPCENGYAGYKVKVPTSSSNS